ncbi:MAG: arylesterase [Desulfosarcina sp.]|jgi:acyl-CoA thioesterase-1
MDKHMKRPFWFNLFVEVAFRLLGILQYACAFKHGITLIVKQTFYSPPASGTNGQVRHLPMKGLSLMLVGIGLIAFGYDQGRATEEQAAVIQTPAAAREGTIVAIGDSLTAGLGVAEDQAYPAQLAQRLKADGYNYRVVNAGVSGETSSGTLSRLRWVISSLNPDIVILVTGANDGLRGLDPNLLQANLDQIIQTLTDHQIHVVMAGMLMLPNLGPDYTDAFAQIYPRIAKKHGVIFVPFFLDGVAGNSALNQADRLHPTADGYARVVKTIYPSVIEAIERHQSN